MSQENLYLYLNDLPINQVDQITAGRKFKHSKDPEQRLKADIGFIRERIRYSFEVIKQHQNPPGKYELKVYGCPACAQAFIDAHTPEINPDIKACLCGTCENERKQRQIDFENSKEWKAEKKKQEIEQKRREEGKRKLDEWYSKQGIRRA